MLSLTITVNPVKLSDGDASSGRLEILYQGRWGGIVVDDGMQDAVALVACRDLGYDYGFPMEGPLYPVNDGPMIWLDGVNCTGEETELGMCEYCCFGKNDQTIENALHIHCGE